jgi:two-component system CheB/CheR fusion protein
MNKKTDFAHVIVSNSHEAIVIVNESFIIKYANNTFYNKLQVSESDIIGKSLSALSNIHLKSKRTLKKLADLLINNKNYEDHEFIQEFPEIGSRTMLLNVNCINQQSNQEQLILISMHDITKVNEKSIKYQKKEKDLLKKDIITSNLEKEKLESAVKKRTKESIQVNKELVIQFIEKEKRAAELITANEELAYQNSEKEKRAEELLAANKELSAFTYIASHDLQEPLRKTQLFISRILEDKDLTLNEKSKDYFNRIQISSNRMQVLINDLLAYSRITETKESLSNINLNDTIRNVLQEPTLVQTIEATNTTVNYKNLPTIMAVSFQMEQLFTNLIINSIKYSDSNRLPVIDIKCEIMKGSDFLDDKSYHQISYYKITVADNGIGFEQQYAEKIFMLFQRLHDKQTYTGTGIGLTICKKIVENHHGFIHAKSISNQGTTILIYLPVSE